MIPNIPAELLRLLVFTVVILAFVSLNALFLVWLERKLAGHFQVRPGPFEVGPHGLLQTLCDGLKLMSKQIVAPAGADKRLFWLAPVLAFAPVFLCFLPIPFGPKLLGMEFEIGVVLILAFSGLGVLATILAGWGSNNKFSLLGASRAVSQTVAYEVPLLITVLGVVIFAGSLNFSEIVNQQGSWPWQWNVLVQPLGFVIFFICALAECNRAPFDLPEAESELTAGFHTEYSSMGFGLFFFAEYSNMVIVSSVGTALFLGGWHGPFADGWWWFAAKVYFLIFVMMWMRWTFPRVRFDQLLNLSWKWLIPLALFNLFYVAVLVKL
jgi:NADH-quinone oxidoreductase subunit H